MDAPAASHQPYDPQTHHCQRARFRRGLVVPYECALDTSIEIASVSEDPYPAATVHVHRIGLRILTVARRQELIEVDKTGCAAHPERRLVRSACSQVDRAD